MIKQEYFCDKCKRQINKGEYMFEMPDATIYRNTVGKQERVHHFSVTSMTNRDLYCRECIEQFLKIPSDKELESARKSKRQYAQKQVKAEPVKTLKED